MSNIVVIGSSNMDLIMKMNRLPKTGETIADCEFSQAFGGKGANQAVGAARSGGNVTFITCLGNDEYAKSMVENFRKDGINTQYVFQAKNYPTGTALIMVGPKGENYITVAPGANYQLSASMIDRSKKVIQDASLVVLQCEILPATIEHVIDICSNVNVPVMLNLAPARNIKKEVFKKLKFLVVNETEAQFLTRIENVNLSNTDEASALLLEMGCENVIITLGENGSFMASNLTSYHIPSFKVKAVDTTAAGDVYCGSLATAISEDKDLRKAVTFASAASAIAVTRLGAQSSAPSRDEIEKQLK